MDCKELRTMIDSYISDELLIETNHGVLRHLENCPACRREISDRRSLKLRLQHIVRNAEETQMDPIFATRLASNLQDIALRPNVWTRFALSGRYLNFRMVAVGFASVLILALGGAVWLNRQNATPLTAQTQNSNTNAELANAVRVSWDEMTSHAVGDHENCAVEYHLKEDPITLDEASVKYAAYNKDLDKVMMAAFKADPNSEVSGDTEFIEAHSCLFEGRRFAHIVVKHKGRIVSVLVTDTDLPGPEDVQTAHFDRSMNAAGFQVGHHAVFVVSQLADADNVMLAKAVSPAMRLHVAKLGA